MYDILFPVSAVLAVMFYMIVMGWRREKVIAATPDEQLVAELKRRAYHRKLRDQACSEVDASLNP